MTTVWTVPALLMCCVYSHSLPSFVCCMHFEGSTLHLLFLCSSKKNHRVNSKPTCVGMVQTKTKKKNVLYVIYFWLGKWQHAWMRHEKTGEWKKVNDVQINVELLTSTKFTDRDLEVEGSCASQVCPAHCATMPALEQVPSLGWPNDFVGQSRPCVTLMLTLVSADLSTTAAKKKTAKKIWLVSSSRIARRIIEKQKSWANMQQTSFSNERERGENDVLKTKSGECRYFMRKCCDAMSSQMFAQSGAGTVPSIFLFPLASPRRALIVRGFFDWFCFFCCLYDGAPLRFRGES